jgi:hypothetical protein
MSKLTYAVVGVALAMVAASPAVAQNSKTAGAASTLTYQQTSASLSDGYMDVNGMSVDIRVPQQEDLTFDVALQCSLATDTDVKTSGGKKATATAEAGIKVRVRIEDLDGDGNVIPGTARYASPNADIGAAPNTGVTYCRRSQTLEALLQGQIDLASCVDAEGNFDPNLCTLTDEEIRLVLSTLSAHAFNFFTYDLASGDYRITVEADPDTGTSSTDGSTASATALIGLGTIVVDEVRFGSVPN